MQILGRVGEGEAETLNQFDIHIPGRYESNLIGAESKKVLIKKAQEIGMQSRKLGNSDLQITPVGYGAWAIGGSGWQFAWGSQDDEDSIAAIHRSLELGVNWIDTAAVYGLGHSEEVVARASRPGPVPSPMCLPNAAASGTKREMCAEGWERPRSAAKPRTV